MGEFDLQEYMSNGEVTKEQLQINATRLIRVARGG